MKYSAVKGVQDVGPPDIYVWQRVEATAREVFEAYGFQEIRPPVIEHTDLFVRSIGETSDIVEKEMYTFSDKGGRSITLRPEGTAPVVRGYVQNHLHNLPAPQKYYYMGPMFRYERPQRGRLRQFYQIGAEAFGSPGPALDAEVLAMLNMFLRRLGLSGLSFQVNSIGCSQCRPRFRDALKKFFEAKKDTLCPDCIRRLDANPLRILDCKVPGCKDARVGSPVVTQYLCEGCTTHFEGLRGFLDALGVSYEVNPTLVRGLDYYSGTTFEVTSADLGAQNAVAAGGRYDGLVKEFGGPQTPAIGFAVGMERLVELLKAGAQPVPAPDLFIVVRGDEALLRALLLAQGLRASGVWVETGGGSMRSQMRRADKLGARRVMFLGEDELGSGISGWKSLHDDSAGEVEIDDAQEFFVNLSKEG